MTTPGLTFHAHLLEPIPGHPDDRPPMGELPDELAGYTRTERDLIVQAVRDDDGIIVGMGGGWILHHPERGLALMVKAAEVNEPYLETSLRSELLLMIMEAARKQGILGVHVPAEIVAACAPVETTPPGASDPSRRPWGALRRRPRCPSCERPITFLQSQLSWNPWRMTCPHCEAPLETSRLGKAAFVVAALLGLLVAVGGIVMSETGRWTRADGILALVSLAIVMLPVAFVSWSRETLRVRTSGTS